MFLLPSFSHVTVNVQNMGFIEGRVLYQFSKKRLQMMTRGHGDAEIDLLRDFRELVLENN